ncbi:hypothetical protein [Sorangium sp. So ce128]|uniref:hypothetical protein n=1 Tax=Sorangium sp. So ce128 TaxID=3133281 RepID=UPI003F63859A
MERSVVRVLRTAPPAWYAAYLSLLEADRLRRARAADDLVERGATSGLELELRRCGEHGTHRLHGLRPTS